MSPIQVRKRAARNCIRAARRARAIYAFAPAIAGVTWSEAQSYRDSSHALVARGLALRAGAEPTAEEAELAISCAKWSGKPQTRCRMRGCWNRKIPALDGCKKHPDARWTDEYTPEQLAKL